MIASGLASSAHDPRGVLLAVFALPLLVAGMFGTAVYALLLVAPARGVRWRYAVLPAATVALVVDPVLAAVVLVSPSIEPAGTLLTLSLFVGGAYVVAYAHGQVPRIIPEDRRRTDGRDYFRALARELRDLDRAQRMSVLAELRSHVDRMDVDRLPPGERNAAISRVLGPPREVAERYLGESDPMLAPNRRRVTNVVLAVSILGIAVGTAVLAIGLNGAWFDGRFLTVQGLLASAGLFPLSVAGLACTLRLRRNPRHWPDVATPAVAIAPAAAFVIVAALSAADRLIEPIPRPTYHVLGAYEDSSGDLHLFWTKGRVLEQGPLVGIEGPPEEAYLSHLDVSRNLVSTEPFPVQPIPSSLLAFTRRGDSWVALSGDRLMVWGPSSSLGWVLDPFPAMVSAASDIGDTTAALARVGFDRTAGRVFLAFDVLNWSAGGAGTDAQWDREFPMPLASGATAAASADRILVVVAAGEQTDMRSSASVAFRLYDRDGVEIRNATIAQEAVVRNGADDALNGTSIPVPWVFRAGSDGFWIVGTRHVSANGTAVTDMWATWVTPQGSTTTVELHRFQAAAIPSPPRMGDETWWVGASAVDGGSEGFFVGVAASLVRWVGGDAGYRPVDPAAGGLFVTRLLPAGSVDYTIRVGDAAQGGTLPLAPLLSQWRGDPTAVQSGPCPSPDCATWSVVGYTISSPTRRVERRTFEVQLEQGLLIFLASVGGTAGLGAARGVVELPAQVFLRDAGIFDWRRSALYPTSPLVPAPGLLRIDALAGTAHTVLFAQAERPPDTVLNVLAVSTATSLATASGILGHPRARARRASRALPAG